MGQQTLGHYPVHFHMNGDVDERGGYDPPTSVSNVSIHHSFSRCVTIHSSNGLMVSFFSLLFFCNVFVWNTIKLVIRQQISTDLEAEGNRFSFRIQKFNFKNCHKSMSGREVH